MSEELKAAGKVAAWVNGEQLRLCAVSPRHDEPDNPMMHGIGRNIAGSAVPTSYCDTPLYAAPPAIPADPDMVQVSRELLERFDSLEVDGFQGWASEAYETLRAILSSKGDV